jgi:archaellum component FlaC
LDSRFDAINPINERLNYIDERLNYIDERLNYIDEQINKIRKGPLKRMAARFSNSIKKRIKVQ